MLKYKIIKYINLMKLYKNYPMSIVYKNINICNNKK